MERQQTLRALIEQPSVYEILVGDNSMLPKKLKYRKTISFSVNPPSLEVLARCALPALMIPESVRDAKTPSLEEALKYRREMAEVFAILAHGKATDYPDWYVPFILNNITPKELYVVFYESVLKMQTDFFLSSLKIVNNNNPMMMN